MLNTHLEISSPEASHQIFSNHDIRDVLNSGQRYLFIPLLLLILFYCSTLLFIDSHAPSNYDFPNTIGPITLLLSLSMALYKIVKSSILSMWTPFNLFLVQSILFFGFGPLVYTLGNPQSQFLLNFGPLALTSQELLRTNLLSTLGILSVVVGLRFATATNFFLESSICPGAKSRTIRMETLAVLFLLSGLLLKYGFVLPYKFGLSSFVIPGFLTSLINLFDLGLAIVAYLGVFNRRWRLLLWLILPLHMAVVLLEFAKTPLMYALILPALGAFLAHQNIRRFIGWFLLAFVFLLLLQPFVHYGRLAITNKTGTIYRATLQERMQIAHSVFNKSSLLKIAASDASQAGWMRLSYSGPQAFAIREYDAGRAGDTLESVWTVFIPRILWPDKPVGISPGEDFYERVTGRRGTFLGLSIYGDAFWQFGWGGVVVVCVCVGFIFAFMSKWSIAWVQLKNFIFLPAILIGVSMGLNGPTKFIVNGIVGPLPIYLSYILAAIILIRIAPPRHY